VSKRFNRAARRHLLECLAERPRYPRRPMTAEERAEMRRRFRETWPEYDVITSKNSHFAGS
jgi:hypothetical protein